MHASSNFCSPCGENLRVSEERYRDTAPKNPYFSFHSRVIVSPKFPTSQLRAVVRPIRRSSLPSGPKRRQAEDIQGGRLLSRSSTRHATNANPRIQFPQTITATMPTLRQPFILSNRRNGLPYSNRRTAHLFWLARIRRGTNTISVAWAFPLGKP